MASPLRPSASIGRPRPPAWLLMSGKAVQLWPRHGVKIWYDAEGDYLEVIFDQKPAYFCETAND